MKVVFVPQNDRNYLIKIGYILSFWFDTHSTMQQFCSKHLINKLEDYKNAAFFLVDGLPNDQQATVFWLSNLCESSWVIANGPFYDYLPWLDYLNTINRPSFQYS